ncbi:LAME_0C08196g1_1 [Lachancea meyersii CBS 8951]|uniref:methylated diphthine methylhydrolase n=1 Tax=Lachancea meyersii CBS 8951 TaxID=1266667 RepID=A0A1G4J3D6_9SACH|nr:LAME_0C08196g1_1 [Lachancea meyersii CBS 8951]
MPASESPSRALAYAEKPPCALRIFHDKYIILGTYDLDKPSGLRTGSVEVRDCETRLLEQYEAYGAILDIKLSPFDDTLIASAHSTGNIQLWKVCVDDNDVFLRLDELVNLQIFNPNVLITSLHFSPSNPGCLVVTATTGETRAVDIENDSTTFSASRVANHYEKVESHQIDVQGQSVSIVNSPSRPFGHEHGLECWTAEFGNLSPFQDVVFTGGDDATIAAHDLRSGDNIWANSRTHEAGVVAIKTSTPTFRNNKPTSIVTGSYDDHIRTLDLRMCGDSIYPGNNIPPAKSTSLNLGGGVWRFVESPENSDSNMLNKLMVCCMYDGAKIVTVGDDDEFSSIGYIKKNHESMCYGGDWSPSMIATCSFYDKVVQVWDETS